MVKTKIIALAALVLLAGSCQPQFSWQKHRMDGHRTGVTVPTANNVDAALGTIQDSIYVAPNGKTFPLGSATYAAAANMIAVQPRMASLKEVIAFAPRAMVAGAPESELSNWWVDRTMIDVERLTGRKVDVGIVNFGGIRVDFPQGDILVDDVVSMFPFKNYLVYVGLQGTDLQALFDQMAATRTQALGGVKFVLTDHHIDTLLVGGAPIDPDKVYGVATVDFLLDGGDGLSVARNAREMIITEQRVIDLMLPYVRSLGESGTPLEYKTDGRVVVRKGEGK
ncbi:MAG: 5'-nucleotidase C-terminal domain-containing protein [Bacteroidales bacterium]|nr:5'-nucleotidase C-terminal domain-containing protein [Bacteroidales bacterium]